MAALRAQWFLPTESDEELAQAGLKELEAQSVAAPATAPDTDDEDSDLMAWPGWPAFQANLMERFGKTGAFKEPTFTPPSPPPRPTLVEGGELGSTDPDCIDGRPVMPWEEVNVPPRAKKAPKAGSVAAATPAPEERHKRAVLALVGEDGRGAARSQPIDPIDAADLETCRSALKAVREAVYGVGVDDVKLSAWRSTTTAQTPVWLIGAPLVLDRSAEVHDAMAEFGLDVHEENEALVAYAEAAGVMLVGADDLDWPGERRADAGGEE